MPYDIDYFRDLSKQIDDLYATGNQEQGRELLQQAIQVAEAEGNEAYTLFFQGEWAGYVEQNQEKQLAFFSQAVDLRPDDFLLLRNKGVALAHLGREEEALAYFDQALFVNQQDYNALRQKGVALFQLGRELEALEYFDHTLAVNSQDYHALRVKGVALSKLGREEEALAYFDQALAVNVRDCHSLRQKGVSLSKLGRESEALEHYDKALALNPQDNFSLQQKGVSLSKLGRDEEALANFDQALAVNPQDHTALRQKGVSLSILGRESEALAYFDQALAVNPQDYAALRSKGVSLAKLGRESEALVLYDKALNVNPRDNDALRNKGVALSRLGQESEALAYFDQALAVNPQDYNSLRQKGVSLSRLGRESEALELYDQALAVNPQDYFSLQQKGVSLSKLGRDEDALAYFDKALVVNPQDCDALRQKGVSLSKLKRYPDALECFDRALAINNEDPSSYLGIATVYYRQNQKNLAFTNIEKALSIAPNNRSVLEAYSFILGALRAERGQGARDQLDVMAVTDVGSGAVVGSKDKSSLNELLGVLETVREKCKPKKIKDFIAKMHQTEGRRKDFLVEGKSMSGDAGQEYQKSIFFVLRKWNSFTPSIPTGNGDRYVGGGYFWWHKGFGIVIDPGYNFIENFYNAGGQVSDISAIVLTHDHNDHTHDFESLLTLLYEYNEDRLSEAKEEASKTGKPVEPKTKQVDVYMNLGCFKKFSGLLDLRRARYLRRVHALSIGQQYRIVQGLEMRPLPAYHEELMSKDYAVGLHFSITNDKKVKHVVMTSDTGLFPRSTKSGEASVADTSKPEIWRTYKLEQESITLLVAHLGSLKEVEFTTSLGADLAKAFYVGHLGVNGVTRVIAGIRPTVAVVSEYGEELKDFMEELSEIICKATVKYLGKTGKKVKVFPGDLSFIFDVLLEQVYCPLSEKFVDVGKARYGIVDKKDFYYFRSRRKDISKLGEKSSEFVTARRKLRGKFFA